MILSEPPFDGLPQLTLYHMAIAVV